ncbi:hypothetical protein [Croceiramulus getboli]|nr:hypothetical protein P8624_06885 [Flavobacteriaceae bacterium YJPT1-3]
MRHYSILMVVDELIASILMETLRIDRRSVIIATHFEQVEKLLPLHQFSLVVTTLYVDGINTNDYLGILNDALPDTPIVVLSEVEASSVESEIKMQGIEEFIHIPIPLDLMKTKLDPYVQFRV